MIVDIPTIIQKLGIIFDEMRHIRIFGMSSFELILTMGVIILMTMLESKSVLDGLYRILKYSIIALIIAIEVHWLFGVNTALNWQLGLSKCPPDLDSMTGVFSDCRYNWNSQCTVLSTNIITDCSHK